MQTRITILAATLTLAAATLAQEPPKPPAQVAKFSAVLGKWQGSGTTAAEAGGDAMPWKASMEVTRILDGFFVMEDLQIEVGTPTPVRMKTIYGYDTENQRYVAFGMNNAGPSHFGEYFFPERGVLMSDATHLDEGSPVFARATWRRTRDGLTYQCRVAEGTGAMRPYIDGKFQRADSLPELVAAPAFMDTPVPDEMTRLTKHMAGTYGVQGTMTMMPGMPEMKISGQEVITPAFGGHVLASVVTATAEGDDAAYRAENYITWNPRDRCYDLVAFDNMGMVSKSQGRWASENELVTTWSGLAMGQPTAAQGVVKFGEHGMSSVVMHSIVGTHAPTESFNAKYERRSN